MCKHGALNASFFVYGLFEKRNTEQVQWPYLYLKAVPVSCLNMLLLSVCTVVHRSKYCILNIVGEYAVIFMADICMMCSYIDDVKFQTWGLGLRVLFHLAVLFAAKVV